MGIKKTPVLQTDRKVFIAPWKDVEKFPSIPISENESIETDEGWRDVELRVPAMSVRLVDRVMNAGIVKKRGYDEQGRAFLYDELDSDLRIRIYCDDIVDGWRGIDDEGGGEADYDPEFLKFTFRNNPFLFGRLLTYMTKMVTDYQNASKLKEKKFPPEQGGSSKKSSKGSASQNSQN